LRIIKQIGVPTDLLSRLSVSLSQHIGIINSAVQRNSASDALCQPSEIYMTIQADRIRVLNDRLRQDLGSGMAVMTPGVAALGQEAVQRIVKTIQVYDDFCHANDPHEEHDFGAFDVDGKRIFFKIDYYDPTLTVHSPDPSDPAVTTRVITIMLGEEY
jgi:hypothetical protein